MPKNIPGNNNDTGNANNINDNVNENTGDIGEIDDSNNIDNMDIDVNYDDADFGDNIPNLNINDVIKNANNNANNNGTNNGNAVGDDEPVMFRVNDTTGISQIEFINIERTGIPSHILNSNNPAVITEYLKSHKAELRPVDKAHLKERRDVLNIIENKQASISQSIDGKIAKMEPEAPVEADDTVILNNIHQKEFQSSGNGCWSVAFSNIMQSRGIDMPQQFIRAHRPGTDDLVTDEQKRQYNEANMTLDINEMYSMDKPRDLRESGELITKVLPNTGTHSRNFGAIADYLYDVERIEEGEDIIYRAKPQPKNQAGYDAFKNAFKDSLAEGIKVNRSPVAITDGYHYLTIVGYGKKDGVEGFYYQDSLDYMPFEQRNRERGEEHAVDKVRFKSYDEFFKGLAEKQAKFKDINGEYANGFGIDMTWAEDYEKVDGQCRKLTDIGLNMQGDDVIEPPFSNNPVQKGEWQVMYSNPERDYNKDAIEVVKTKPVTDFLEYRDTVVIPKKIIEGQMIKKEEMAETVGKFNSRETEIREGKPVVQEDIGQISYYEDRTNPKPELGPSDLSPSDRELLAMQKKNASKGKNENAVPVIDREVIFKSDMYSEYITDMVEGLINDDDLELFNPVEGTDKEKAFDKRCDSASWGESLKEAKVHLQTLAKCYEIYADEEKRKTANLKKLDDTINYSLLGLKASVNEYLKNTGESNMGEKNKIAQKLKTSVNQIISRREAVGGNAEQRYESLANATEGLFDFTKRLSRIESDNIFSRNSDEFNEMLRKAREIRDKVRPNYMKNFDMTVDKEYLKSEAFKKDVEDIKKLADKYRIEKDKDNKAKRSTKKGQARYDAAVQLSKFCAELKRDAERAADPRYNTKQYKLGKWTEKSAEADEIDRIVSERREKIGECYRKARVLRPDRDEIMIRTRVTAEELNETEKKEPVKKEPEKKNPVKNQEKNNQVNKNPENKAHEKKSQEDIIKEKPVKKVKKPKKVQLEL